MPYDLNVLPQFHKTHEYILHSLTQKYSNNFTNYKYFHSIIDVF